MFEEFTKPAKCWLFNNVFNPHNHNRQQHFLAHRDEETTRSTGALRVRGVESDQNQSPRSVHARYASSSILFNHSYNLKIASTHSSSR